MGKRPRRGVIKDEIPKHRCRVVGCCFDSPNAFGLNTHIRMIHTNEEDREVETFADPVEYFSDPAFQEVSEDHVSVDSEHSIEKEKSGQEENRLSSSDEDEFLDDDHISVTVDLAVDQKVEKAKDDLDVAKQASTHNKEEEEIFQCFDLSIISPEDLKFFQLSKIALTSGFSQKTFTEILEFMGDSFNVCWKNNARTHWAVFERLCMKYGFKDNPHLVQKEVCLDDLNIYETVTFNYVNPRKAVIRLLRSTDFDFFDKCASDGSKTEYKEFFSGLWARKAEQNMKRVYNLNNTYLLGIMIMTDSSTINLRSSKKPFYIALANCHYSYRNNINCMECVGKFYFSQYDFLGYIPEAPLIKKGNSTSSAELKRYIQYSAYDHIVRELKMDNPIKFRMKDGQIYNFVIRV